MYLRNCPTTACMSPHFFVFLQSRDWIEIEVCGTYLIKMQFLYLIELDSRKLVKNTQYHVKSFGSMLHICIVIWNYAIYKNLCLFYALFKKINFSMSIKNSFGSCPRIQYLQVCQRTLHLYIICILFKTLKRYTCTMYYVNIST